MFAGGLLLSVQVHPPGRVESQPAWKLHSMLLERTPYSPCNPGLSTRSLRDSFVEKHPHVALALGWVATVWDSGFKV